MPSWKVDSGDQRQLFWWPIPPYFTCSEPQGGPRLPENGRQRGGATLAELEPVIGLAVELV